MILEPRCTPLDALSAQLRDRGYAVLSPPSVASLCGCTLAQLHALAASWDDLPADGYLKDGGRYRRRRHACFTADFEELVQVPHRAHWQPLEYNALHGGMERWFEPVRPDVVATGAWRGLLRGVARVASALRGTQPWYLEAHQFRIDTEGGIGRPTPEGAHRDGVDLVAVFLVQRRDIKGGETRVFQADGPSGERFTLAQPWSALLLDDARVIHETTPVQPVGAHGWRDTLVITCRAGGFQGA